TEADLGAGYVFRDGATGWSEEIELYAPGFPAGGYWGWSVAMRDDIVVLASPWVSDGVIYTCGAGYVFRRLSGVWYSDHAVFASDRYQNDTFGRSVAFTSHDFLIGAPLDGSSSGVYDSAGRVYRFNRDEIVTVIEPSQPPPGTTVKFRSLCGDPGDPVMLVL